MCTVVFLLRPGHPWPLLLAANRDEMADRPWLPPGRHWPDRADVTAGKDVLAGGTWFGLNDAGVVAGVLNRINTLGPAPGLRSRGELPLEALDHADARSAAEALAALDPDAYRPFNLFVADAREAYWIRATHAEGGVAGHGRLDVFPIPAGCSMLTAYDLNDTGSPRIGRHLPRFRHAAVPDPERDDWSGWTALMADQSHDPAVGPGGAMTVVTETGFGTVSSTLLALPGVGRWGVKPVWRFAAGRPSEAPYRPVSGAREAPGHSAQPAPS
ncbi:MAG: hypothetical protein EA405_01755 [Rhodospirillales bacterium]|nr:MAG: hypothetical protein EA405_01755 [Rhodospirillales bacterium]